MSFEMDTIGDDESQGSDTLSSSLFTSSGLITGSVIDKTPITTFPSPYISTSAIRSELDDDDNADDGDFPSLTTIGLGDSTSNSTATSSSTTILTLEPSAPTVGRPTPTIEPSPPTVPQPAPTAEPPAPTTSAIAPPGSGHPIGTGEH